jgi:hypothetical protein
MQNINFILARYDLVTTAFTIITCVDHPPSYVQHYVSQNLSPLKVSKFFKILKCTTCFGQHGHHQMLKICLMRKSLLSLVADAYAGPSDACVCVLCLVCHAPPCCVLHCVSCVVFGVLCSSLLCSSLCVVCCVWCVMLLPVVFFVACPVPDSGTQQGGA